MENPEFKTNKPSILFSMVTICIRLRAGVLPKLSQKRSLTLGQLSWIPYFYFIFWSGLHVIILKIGNWKIIFNNRQNILENITKCHCF